MKPTKNNTRVGQIPLANNSPRENATDGLTKHLALICGILTSQVIPSHPTGFSFDPQKLACIDSRDSAKVGAYIVSVKGFELQTNGIPSQWILMKWLRRVAGLIVRPGYLIGGWWQNGVFYLDISLAMRGREEAIAFARWNHQKAIFHLESSQTLFV